MRAGRLDRRIVIQKKTLTHDEWGEEVETWADLMTVWAQQQPDRGDERFAHQQLLGTAAMTFVIRARPDLALTVEHRISYHGRTWDITDVRELGRNQGLEVDAKARVDTP